MSWLPPPANPSIPDEDVSWVAEFLGVSKSWVYQATASGKLPCVRIGALVRFIGALVRFVPTVIEAWVKGETPGAIITLPPRITTGHRQRTSSIFGAANPEADSLAYLRIADSVSAIVARLANGAGELTLRCAGFAPAGRLTEFHEVIASFTPFRPTSAGRTPYFCSTGASELSSNSPIENG